jgi:hypothetical protein
MSDEQTELEKFIEEVLKKFMVDRAMYEGVKASSTRGLHASPSIAQCSSCDNVTTEKQSKHRDDLANVKQIPSILLDYIPPLTGTVNYNNVPQNFEYILITAYIPKGICVVGSQLGQIPSLKNNDFNLGDRKNYTMLTPHRYLTKTTSKKPHIVSQSWIKE